MFLAGSLGLDVIDLLSENRGALRDEDVVALAKELRRVVITFDLDFGEIYHSREKGKLGVIVLRLEDQTVQSVNRVLARFFNNEAAALDMDRSLVIISEHRIRIITDE